MLVHEYGSEDGNGVSGVTYSFIKDKIIVPSFLPLSVTFLWLFTQRLQYKSDQNNIPQRELGNNVERVKELDTTKANNYLNTSLNRNVLGFFLFISVIILGKEIKTKEEHLEVFKGKKRITLECYAS